MMDEKEVAGLVERLRERVSMSVRPGATTTILCADAADALTTQAARIAELVDVLREVIRVAYDPIRAQIGLDKP
tara:strand:+ start:223 stop:444 length:222 start_codon:yes stop_codon:yes gene_type:complete